MIAKRNIIIGKAGGNSSSKNYKVSLPAGMVKYLGITEDDRAVEVYTSQDNIGKLIVIRRLN